MGMLSHAAVMRSDGTVFSHLHPTGNYSMAAQSFFAAKLAREVGDAGAGTIVASGHADHSMHYGMNHSMHQGHSAQSKASASSLILPYEFPEPGDYRIWVQFKSAGKVLTAAFDAKVEP
jgi:hypothetical protein